MEKKEDVLIAQEAIRILVEGAREKGLNTPHTRFAAQQPRCEVGLKGLCCQVCSEGPCRVSDTTLGVCGLNVDNVVAKNFLRHVAAGVACYVHVCENSARTMKAIKNAPYEIKNPAKLKSLATRLGINTNQDDKSIAQDLGEFILRDIHRPSYEESLIVRALSPAKRLKVYEKLGIIPGGPKSEVFDALVKSGTNLNANVMDMLLHVLRMGLVMGYVGLAMNIYINDILLGTPQITEICAGLASINPDDVNIMTAGHQNILQDAIIQAAKDETLLKMARAAGANKITVVGATCVGQDIQARWSNYGAEGVYTGQICNNFGTEPLVASGLIDAVCSEFNCTFPGLTEIAKRLKVKLMNIDNVAFIEGTEHIKWSPENALVVGKEVVRKSIEAFSGRQRGQRQAGEIKATIGFSDDFLIARADVLIEAMKSGKVKGVAAVVGCSNLTSGGHDVFTKELTEELIKRDIVVWTAGCTAYSLQGLGFMSYPEALEKAGNGLREVCQAHGFPPVWDLGICMSVYRVVNIAEAIADKLGVDLPDLPAVASAPQWLEEQAIGDAAFALDCGFLLHVYPDPFISGSKLVTKILTHDLEGLTGGKLLVEKDPCKTADILEKHINEKRQKLGLA